MSVPHRVSRRACMASAFFLTLPLAATRAIGAVPDASSFIVDLGDHVLKLLGDKQRSVTERGQDFEHLAVDAFDFPRIARFTLGNYWRTASDDQKQRYETAFQAYMVKFYWSQFSSFNAADFKVTKQRDSGSNFVVVSTEIDRPTQGPIAADWTVAKVGDGFKIIDVSIGGISQLLTYRDQFASTLDRNGGNVGALTDQLKQKSAN
ncbi:MAG TPA: ABC transporter substrate-binding protein [Stellaceae bacterium]|nr:ABC transporter substrate-binding protein [Stellaceae bacterium]